MKLIYDHRVLDGAYIARRLRDIEEALNGPIRNELRIDLEGTKGHRDGPPPNVEPLLKPHLPTIALDRDPSDQAVERRP